MKSSSCGLRALSVDLWASCFKNSLPYSPHVPKCSSTNGMMLVTELLGSLNWSYLAFLSVSL